MQRQRHGRAHRRRKRTSVGELLLTAVIMGALAGAGAAWHGQPEPAPAAAPARPTATPTGEPAVRAHFGLCHTGGGRNCVVDGDTIWLNGRNIRIADIDAPETHEYDCGQEKALGDRATRRLRQLVNSGPVTLGAIDRDEDSYGRKLRLVYVNGTGVGDTLVSEGLARYYEGGRRSWCD